MVQVPDEDARVTDILSLSSVHFYYYIIIKFNAFCVNSLSLSLSLKVSGLILEFISVHI